MQDRPRSSLDCWEEVWQHIMVMPWICYYNYYTTIAVSLTFGTAYTLLITLFLTKSAFWFIPQAYWEVSLDIFYYLTREVIKTNTKAKAKRKARMISTCSWASTCYCKGRRPRTPPNFSTVTYGTKLRSKTSRLMLRVPMMLLSWRRSRHV